MGIEQIPCAYKRMSLFFLCWSMIEILKDQGFEIRFLGCCRASHGETLRNVLGIGLQSIWEKRDTIL